VNKDKRIDTEKEDLQNPLKAESTVRWLRKRFSDKAQPFYVNTPHNLLKLDALDLLFSKFDEDNNGTLELSELLYMFQENGFNVAENELEIIYQVVTKIKPYKMTRDQFKKLMLSDVAKKAFHDVMLTIKKHEKGRICHEDERKIYFPMNLNAMLNYLYMKMKHENLFDEITDGLE